MIIPRPQLFKGVFISNNFFCESLERIVDNICNMDCFNIVEYNAGGESSYSFYRIHDSLLVFDERDEYQFRVDFKNRDAITKAISEMKGWT